MRRRHRIYQWARRASLGGVWLALLLVPVLHAQNFARRLSMTLPSHPLSWLVPASSKPGLIGAPWSLNLFGLELLDPLAAVALVSTGAMTVDILIAAIPTVVLVAILGRYFCGWLCPYRLVLALSNNVRAFLKRRGFECHDAELPRGSAFAALAVFVGLGAAAGTHVLASIYPPVVMAREVFHATIFGGVGAGTVMILAAFAFDTFYTKSGFCRGICPGGALFRLLGMRSPIQVSRDAERCTDCHLCDRVCSMAQRPMTDVQDSGCERCGLCISVCPTDALQFKLGSALPILHPAAHPPISPPVEAES